MIFSSVYNKSELNFLPNEIKTCVDYAEKNCLSHFEKGEYRIDENIKFSIESYKTDYKENRFWEAHKQNFFLYLTLTGREYAILDFTENMKKGKYIEKDDFLKVKPASRLACRGSAEILMEKGCLLLCSPQDAYMTAVTFNEPEFVKRAVFKFKN